jgi:hypothetical protein
MSFLTRFLIAMALVIGCAAPLLAQSQKPPEQQTEYVPLKDAPPRPELPAERLVIAAYSFVVLTLFVYLLSLSKRLGAVKADIARLESDVKRTPGS